MRQVRSVLAVVISGVLLAGCARGAPSPASRPDEPVSATTPTYDVPSLDRPLPTAQPVPVGSAGAQPRGASESDAGPATTASAVALAFARTACRYDARIDRSPWDASRRAARQWGTPSYAASLNVPAPDSGGQRWITLAAHDGYTVADATLADLDVATPDAPMRALRQVDVTIRPVGARGWRGAPEARTFLLTLVRVSSADRWRVAGVQTL